MRAWRSTRCTLQQVLMRVLDDLHVPVGFGLKSGHVSNRNFTLPFGVRATLEVGPSVSAGLLKLRFCPSAQRQRRNHEAEAHPSDRHLWNCDGFARRDAEAARLSGHRIRQCGISPNVRLPGFVGHSGVAAFWRTEPGTAPRSGHGGQRDLARQSGAGGGAGPANSVRIHGAGAARRVSGRTRNGWW